MSAHGTFTPPAPVNEPIKSYAPGSPEREELQARLRQMEGERIRIPMVIGGKDVDSGETYEAVMPHKKSHVLADVAKGGPEHVQQAIDAAREAHHDWSRLPWHERAAVFLRAAELLSGPWRSTVNAATMLNQSKTSHQAEIDTVCEMIDFWRSTPSSSRASTPSSRTRRRARGTAWSTGRSKASCSRSARLTSRASAATSRARPR